MHKLMIMAAATAATLALAGCATGGVSLEDYAKAANELDPDCYKNVHVELTPLVVMGWVVPVVGGRYDKVCNPDQASVSTAQPRVPLAGAVIPNN